MANANTSSPKEESSRIRGEFQFQLRDGLKQAAKRRGRTVKAIGEEITRKIRPESQNWVRTFTHGNAKIPAKLSDVELLAKEVARLGNLDREWMNKLLTAAGHPRAAEVSGDFFSPLPARPYRQLIGREAEVTQIVERLCAPSGSPIVVIAGMGGMGKTACAREVVERCLAQEEFAGVVWIPVAAAEGQGAQEHDPRDAFFVRLVDELWWRLKGQTPPAEMDKRHLQQEMRKHLAGERILIVLDGVEAVGDEADSLLGKLATLAGDVSKVLLTSRRSFGAHPKTAARVNLFTLHLTGLDREALPAFVAQVAHEQGVKVPNIEDEGAWQSIYAATGGAPLMMRVVAAQLAWLPVKTLLDRIGPLRYGDALQEDKYVAYYGDILQPSWDRLSSEGRTILSAMSLFAASAGAAYQALADVCGLFQHAFDSGLRDAQSLCLLETRFTPDDGAVRYFLHALTHQYVTTKVARQEDLIQPVLKRTAPQPAAPDGRQERDAALETVRWLRAARPRFTDTFLGYLQQAAGDLRRIDPEIENVLVALELVAATEQTARWIDGVVQVYPYLQSRGRYAEGQAWLERAQRKAAEGDAEAVRPEIWLYLGAVQERQGQYDQVLATLLDGMAEARRCEDAKAMAEFLVRTANVLCTQRRYAEAEQRLQEALGISRDVADRRLETTIQAEMGRTALLQHRYADANALYQSILPQAQRLGDPDGLARILNGLGVVAAASNEIATATANYREALRWAEKSGNVELTSLLQLNLGIHAHHAGNLDRAAEYLHGALAQTRRLGRLPRLYIIELTLALIAGERGDMEQAECRLYQCLEVAYTLARPSYLARLYVEWGKLHLQHQQFEAAAERYARCLHHVGEEHDLLSWRMQALFGLAQARFGQGRVQDVQRIVEQCRSIRPDATPDEQVEAEYRAILEWYAAVDLANPHADRSAGTGSANLTS